MVLFNKSIDMKKEEIQKTPAVYSRTVLGIYNDQKCETDLSCLIFDEKPHFFSAVDTNRRDIIQGRQV